MTNDEPTADTSNQEESTDLYLSQLKRSMAGFLAHKITFSLIEAGQNDLLLHTLEKLVDERLAELKVQLEPSLKARLVEEIYSGLPLKKAAPPLAVEPDGLEKFRPAIASYLAQHISNNLLNPGHEKALARRIQILINEKLILDHAQISEELKQELLAKFCEVMNVPVPDPLPQPIVAPTAPSPAPPPLALTPAQPTATKPSPEPLLDATPEAHITPAPHQIKVPAPSLTKTTATVFELPPTPPEKAPTKKVPSLSIKAPKKEIGKEVEEVEFTEEYKRQLLLTLGSRLDPLIMGSNDSKLIYQHIMSVLNLICQEENLELDDEVKQLLLNGILTGEGLEFQL